MAVFLKGSRFLRLTPAHILLRPLSTEVPKKGLVLGVYYEENKQGLELTPEAAKYNQMVDGKLCQSLNLIDSVVKEGKCYVFWNLDCQHKAVAIVGLGKKCKGFDELEKIDKDKEAVRVAAVVGCRAMRDIGVKSISVDSFNDAEASAEGCTLGLWKFQECKSIQECPPEINLFSSVDCELQFWNTGIIKASAQNIARKLTDMPANLMTPSIFVKNVEDIFRGLDVCIDVHDRKWAQDKQMNAFLAVAQGSCEPPKFLEITYSKGVPDDGPFILVGKGITFDTGGISLKPVAKMDYMRGDMGGAAACVAALRALVCLNVPANIKVLIPLTENMPSGSAIKPGDVVKAMNGKSICIDNTDAEGRLILADALAYSACFKPKWVMDVATLTGGVKVALGSAAAGVFTNSTRLYEFIEKAGGKTGDRMWRLPLWTHYTNEMTGYSAYDINNNGKGRGGSSATAAAFLREFAPPCVDWLHLDIAGVSGPGGPQPKYLSNDGMTGRPTRTIIEFVESQARVSS